MAERSSVSFEWIGIQEVAPVNQHGSQTGLLEMN